MSMRYKGAVISATPPTTSTSAATGVWTLVQQMQAQGAGTWPVVIGGTYWIGLLGSASDDDTAFSMAVDTSGNVYICGSSNRPGFTQKLAQLVKYNSTGNLLWQKALYGVYDSAAYGISLDSSNNIYVGGYNRDTGNYDFQIEKYNSSGTLQWQRTLSGGGDDICNKVAVDPSGNLYVCGISSNNIQLAKYNTSGNVQWQKTLSNGFQSSAQSIATDASGNVYICGYGYLSGTQYGIIAKYDTSGAIQWQNIIGTSITNIGRAISVDSSGNIYTAGTSINLPYRYALIEKYNNSGTKQWSRQLIQLGSADGFSVSFDLSGNVYVVGQSYASGANNLLYIAKYNSTGTIQWQRTLGNTSSSQNGYGSAVDLSGNIYVCGSSAATGSNNFLFSKLPSDGSLTGTYSIAGYNFVYAAAGLTDASSTLTSSAASFSSASSSLTEATSTFQEYTTNLTSSVTTL